jgi:serine phosphatase RsbU (regulator of sigma subunit)
MRAAMVLPMTAGDEVVGAFTFVSAESGRTFDDDDFAFAQDLARRAATAVQNGRRYAEQVRVAQTLQRSLLPERLPEVPGWRAGASYAAGDERAEVGGDFYDVVPTAGGHLIVLGDVTGKGVEAAALTALVRHSAQMAARFDRRPSALLAVVNEVLREQPRLAPVSVVCALVERGERSPCVTIASAGHPLPLLKRAGEPPREVGRHDVLLGVVDQRAFAEETIEVEVGDALLFYTDGVLDAPGQDERFGEERLLAAVAAAPADPPALLHTIEGALRSFATGAGPDDRAMLALRYTGPRVPSPAGPPMTGVLA